jgi:hypothetical protein
MWFGVGARGALLGRFVRRIPSPVLGAHSALDTGEARPTAVAHRLCCESNRRKRYELVQRCTKPRCTRIGGCSPANRRSACRWCRTRAGKMSVFQITMMICTAMSIIYIFMSIVQRVMEKKKVDSYVDHRARRRAGPLLCVHATRARALTHCKCDDVRG